MSAHEASTSEPSFLDSLSAMLTSTFNQTATSPLTFAAPPGPPPHITKDRLDAVGLEKGIQLLQDHIAYVRLNPIVTDCHAVAADSDEGRKLDVARLLAEFAAGETPLTDAEVAPTSDWMHYTVTDALPHPFGLPGATALKYTIALRNLPNGIESLVASPGGVTIHGDIRAVRATEGWDAESGWRERGEKKLWLQERTEIRCWVGTAWYVRKTMSESHESAHERFRAWWEQEVRKQLGSGADVGSQGVT